MNFVAVRRSPSRIFGAERITITGRTREEVLRNGRAGMHSGNYLARIESADGQQTWLWTEAGSWTPAGRRVLPE